MKRKRKTGDAGSIYEPRRLQLNAPASSPKWLAGALVATNQKCPSHQPFMSTLPCFVSCPPEPTISWTEVDFDTVCPQKPVFSWTGAAQSRRSEPFGVARAACFEQLAGRCQLQCPALRKDLSQSEDKERYIPDTSELCSERLYFRIERLCGCIS